MDKKRFFPHLSSSCSFCYLLVITSPPISKWTEGSTIKKQVLPIISKNASCEYFICVWDEGREKMKSFFLGNKWTWCKSNRAIKGGYLSHGCQSSLIFLAKKAFAFSTASPLPLTSWMLSHLPPSHPCRDGYLLICIEQLAHSRVSPSPWGFIELFKNQSS